MLRANAGGGNFAAFAYQCPLNLDIDGAPNTYGWDNPAALNSLGDQNEQKNLQPLEVWGGGATNSIKQFVGLGNACGDPGDGSKGHKNFVNGSHNFRWASVVAKTRAQAGNTFIIDDRPELEALVDENGGAVAAGHGFFPVVQPHNSKFKGYYISTTATMTDGTLPDENFEKWVNAVEVPYAVLTNPWANVNINGKNVGLGDVGLAINNVTGRFFGFLFGDSSGGTKVGEVSQCLYQTISDGANSLCTFLVFPGSGPGAQVGRHPEGRIGQLLRPLVTKVAAAGNADDLLDRLASGNLQAPGARLTAQQSRVRRNLLLALDFWGANYPI